MVVLGFLVGSRGSVARSPRPYYVTPNQSMDIVMVGRQAPMNIRRGLGGLEVNAGWRSGMQDRGQSLAREGKVQHPNDPLHLSPGDACAK